MTSIGQDRGREIGFGFHVDEYTLSRMRFSVV